jgi:hypothetical protein
MSPSDPGPVAYEQVRYPLRRRRAVLHATASLQQIKPVELLTPALDPLRRRQAFLHAPEPRAPTVILPANTLVAASK